MKINSTISRFLNQTIRAFEDALQSGELSSFRVIRHFSEMFIISVNSSVLQLETSGEYPDFVGSPFAFSLLHCTL